MRVGNETVGNSLNLSDGLRGRLKNGKVKNIRSDGLSAVFEIGVIGLPSVVAPAFGQPAQAVWSNGGDGAIGRPQ